jgi:hypothetical protein
MPRAPTAVAVAESILLELVSTPDLVPTPELKPQILGHHFHQQQAAESHHRRPAVNRL